MPITDISPLASLTGLIVLDLSGNKITILPKAFIERGQKILWKNGIPSEGINLYGNPLESPPVEIVKQGRRTILDWFEIQDIINDEFSNELGYLQKFFNQPARNIEKYRRFLLTAEFLVRHLKCSILDGSVVIMEYAKIVDAILQEFVTNGLPAINQDLKPPYPLGAWVSLCDTSEYQAWIHNRYTKDPELMTFLLTEIAQYTEKIRWECKRNLAVHTEVYGEKEALDMRKLLLLEKDRNNMTFMQWLLRIVYYGK